MAEKPRTVIPHQLIGGQWLKNHVPRVHTTRSGASKATNFSVLFSSFQFFPVVITGTFGTLLWNLAGTRGPPDVVTFGTPEGAIVTPTVSPACI